MRPSLLALALPFVAACGVAFAAAPGAPTNVIAIPGNARATIHLAPPASDGGSPITGYTVTASPGGATASAAAWPIPVTGLANGTSYTFTARAINADGTGPASAASNAVRPVLPTIAPQVVSARTYSMALDAAGQVYAWGSDAVGQLGRNRQVALIPPTQVPGLPATAHIALKQHALAADVHGQVWSWGDACGALGPRDTPNPAKPSRVDGVSGVVKVATGVCQSYALKGDGTVLAWGVLFNGIQAIPFPTGIVEIAAGQAHVLARRNDGTVWAYGSNFHGELGQGHTNPVATVVQVPGIGTATALGAGYFASAALLANGEIRYWGLVNPPQAQLVPAPLTGLGGAAIRIDMDYQCVGAVRADGTVWRWCFSLSGPTQVEGMSGATGIGVSGNGGPTFSFGTQGLVGRGTNILGQLGLGHGDNIDAAVPVPGFASGTAQVVISSIGAAILARKADGSVWFWGHNRAGERGDGAAIGSSVPLAVPLPATIKAISAGHFESSLALDTSGQLWTWGANPGFDGNFGYVSTPMALPGGTNVALLATHGPAFVKNDGTPWISGNFALPGGPQARQIAGATGMVAVAAGGGAVYFVRNDGKVYSAGLNDSGQLGDGTTTARTTLVEVAGIGGAATRVAAASNNACALRADGTVHCWGTPNSGPASLVPAMIPGVSGAVDIAVSSYGGIARLANGSLVGWGATWLGDNGGVYVTPAFPIAFHEPVQAIAIGDGTAAIVGANGLAWGWGNSSTSQTWGTVGDGAYVWRKSPVVLFAHAGSGTLDGNNWYLDLQPASAETIPPASVPSALANARRFGGSSDLALDGVVRYRAADFGKRVNNYVIGVVPPEFLDLVPNAPGAANKAERKAKAAKAGGFILVQLTPQGWIDVNGQLIAYSQGVAGAAGGATNILNGVNAALLAGARFCVGYGESADAMLSSRALREVLLLEGTAATVSGVPCVLSGVYVDGPATSAQGGSASFRASVVGLSPTGSVQFRDGFAGLGSPVALSAMNAAVSRAAVAAGNLVPGPHTIGASYTGDAQNPAATTAIPLAHTVTAIPSGTRTDLAGPVSSLSAAEVTFAATVTGRSPTGTVQFRDGASNLGAPQPLVDGVATLRIASLALGNHSITAAYSGDGGNAASTSTSLSHLVANALGARAQLSASTYSPRIGTPVTLTATVTGASPTGSVRFMNGAAPIGNPVALAPNGQAVTNAAFPPGTHFVTAAYSGDANNPPVSSSAVVLEVALAIDPAYASLDSDGDGMPNGQEAAESTNPFVKDNDLFGNSRLFAMQQYRDFLGREGDAGGIAFWADQLATGAQSRAQMVETYLNSAEFQGTGAPVARLYFAYFLRIPDYGGLNFWIAQFRGGSALETISNAFAGSAEFNNTYGALDNAQFVSLVYQNVLGRAPDAAGAAYWTGQLNAAMTRGQMMVAFSESAEYRSLIANEVYVTMIYSGMLRRAPDAGGFSFWVSHMDAGNSGLALVDPFVASPEYRARFLP